MYPNNIHINLIYAHIIYTHNIYIIYILYIYNIYNVEKIEHPHWLHLRQAVQCHQQILILQLAGAQQQRVAPQRSPRHGGAQAAQGPRRWGPATAMERWEKPRKMGKNMDETWENMRKTWEK